jgi:hypothetical protein
MAFANTQVPLLELYQVLHNVHEGGLMDAGNKFSEFGLEITDVFASDGRVDAGKR